MPALPASRRRSCSKPALPLVDVFDFIRLKARTRQDAEANGRLIASDSVDMG